MRARRLIPLAFGLAAILAIAAVGVTSAGGRPLSTDLSWTEEVNAAGVPNQGEPGATGHASLTLNPGQSDVCFSISVQGTTDIVGAHIHSAVAGTNGPIVVGFVNGLQPAGVREFQGCVQADRQTILAIFHNQAGYYVNVHSTARQGGTVRGQLGD